MSRNVRRDDRYPRGGGGLECPGFLFYCPWGAGGGALSFYFVSRYVPRETGDVIPALFCARLLLTDVCRKLARFSPT